MKKYISMLFAGLMMVSCVDTIILPDDKTVDEDFWKTKSDVELMVNGAYLAMTQEAVVARLIVWGDLRSDELVPSATLSGSLPEDLTEINLANTQDNNVFAEWGSLYSVINRCNIVLERAAEVVKLDPSYTEGDYQVTRSQMLALRALCYFYLVRNFRDVPYVTQAFMNSSQDRDFPQESPETILQNCINDLEMAEQNALLASAYADARKYGYFTRDGIDALLADIYLWRGSVRHDASDYEKAIAYCDKVIASKKAQHTTQGGAVSAQEYPLYTGSEMFTQMFVKMNGEESIFELQYNGSNYGNTAVCKYLNRTSTSSSSEPYLYASDIMGWQQEIFSTTSYTSSLNDWRGRYNTYSTVKATGEFSVYEVRKYVYTEDFNNSPSGGGGNNAGIPQTIAAKGRGYSDLYAQNYIIYRLTDVMLMKAEALNALALLLQDAAGEDVDEEQSEQSKQVNQYVSDAFDLVLAVNSRSNADSGTNPIKLNTYSTPEDMEGLILAERLRELAFEGKRWYDLMRFNYRHVDGVDYTKTLYELSVEGQPNVPTHQPMLDLVKRKLASKGDAVAAKLGYENKLYMPIPKIDLDVSALLHQNPGYGSSGTTEKN